MLKKAVFPRYSSLQIVKTANTKASSFKTSVTSFKDDLLTVFINLELTNIDDHILPDVVELDDDRLRFSDNDLGFDFVRPIFNSACPFTHVESWIQTGNNQSTLICVFLRWTI